MSLVNRSFSDLLFSNQLFVWYYIFPVLYYFHTISGEHISINYLFEKKLLFWFWYFDENAIGDIWFLIDQRRFQFLNAFLAEHIQYKIWQIMNWCNFSKPFTAKWFQTEKRRQPNSEIMKCLSLKSNMCAKNKQTKHNKLFSCNN